MPTLILSLYPLSIRSRAPNSDLSNLYTVRLCVLWKGPVGGSAPNDPRWTVGRFEGDIRHRGWSSEVTAKEVPLIWHHLSYLNSLFPFQHSPIRGLSDIDSVGRVVFSQYQPGTPVLQIKLGPQSWRIDTDPVRWIGEVQGYNYCHPNIPDVHYYVPFVFPDQESWKFRRCYPKVLVLRYLRRSFRTRVKKRALGTESSLRVSSDPDFLFVFVSFCFVLFDLWKNKSRREEVEITWWTGRTILRSRFGHPDPS